MKRSLLFTIFCCALNFAYTQDNDGFFAISGQASSQFNWSDIRYIPSDVSTTGNLIYENGRSKFLFHDAQSKQEIKKFSISVSQKNSESVSSVNLTTPTALMTAAVAFDKKHNKLFFATMYSGHLLYLDLNYPNDYLQFYVVSDPLIQNSDFISEGLNITRMAIGADGNGYAITNDGNHLIRFTTGKKITVSNLGNLIDHPSNENMSIHNQCNGWGGDIVAHASGKLILFTAAKGIYEIDIATRIAKYIGIIKNLPATFSVNGAAVDKDGFVVVSSANVVDAFYKVDMNSLQATKIISKGTPVNASDLASSHLLGQFNKTGAAILPSLEDFENESIHIFPNPVKNGKVRITFANNLPGNYQVLVTDIQGRLLQSKNVIINLKSQVEQMKLDKKTPRGLYFVKIMDEQNAGVFSGRILVD